MLNLVLFIYNSIKKLPNKKIKRISIMDENWWNIIDHFYFIFNIGKWSKNSIGIFICLVYSIIMGDLVDQSRKAMENMSDDQKSQLQDLIKEDDDWNLSYFQPWNF